MYKLEDDHLQLNQTALKNVTFGLSFQYATTPKATRSLSVIYFADRMANAGLFCSRKIREQQPNGVFPSFKSAATMTTSYHLHQTA